jgi:hypothetical protein
MRKQHVGYASLIFGLWSIGIQPLFSADLPKPRAVIEINVLDEKTKKFVPHAVVAGAFIDETGNKFALTEKNTDTRGQYLEFISVNGKFTITVTAAGYERGSVEGQVQGSDIRVSRRIRKNILLKRPTAVPAAVSAFSGESAAKPTASAPVTAQGPIATVEPLTKDQILAETRWDENSMHAAVLDAVFLQSSNLGWAVDKLKNSSESFKEAFLRGLLQMVQAYVSSESFSKDYFQRRKEWYKIEDAVEDDAFPKSPKALLRKRLKWFLDESGSVNFNAKTETKNGFVIFVNEEDERKSYLWKKCFRAGPNLTKIARDFVSDWMFALDQEIK